MHFPPNFEIKLPYCSNLTPLNGFQHSLVLNTPRHNNYHGSEMNITLHCYRLEWNEHETAKQSQGLWFLRSDWEVYKQYSTPPKHPYHSSQVTSASIVEYCLYTYQVELKNYGPCDCFAVSCSFHPNAALFSVMFILLLMHVMECHVHFTQKVMTAQNYVGNYSVGGMEQ